MRTAVSIEEKVLLQVAYIQTTEGFINWEWKVTGLGAGQPNQESIAIEFVQKNKNKKGEREFQ